MKKLYILYFCNDRDEKQSRKVIGYFTTHAKAASAFCAVYRELEGKRTPTHIKQELINTYCYQFSPDYNIKLEITNINDILECYY